MSEPRLEDIEDYDTLKGKKRKVVLFVIFAGIVMSIVYAFAYNMFDNKEETLRVEQSINKIPMK